MNADIDFETAVRALPKVEMHIHLEGTIAHERIVEMAAAVGATLPRPVEELYATDDLSEFLDNLDWVCGLVRTPEMAETLARDYARYAGEQGMIYSEVIVNPTHWSGLDVDTLFRALDAGFSRAETDGLPEVRLLPSILRQQPAGEAMALVEWMGASGIARLAGLSVDGNQANARDSESRFAEAYARARELGFGCTAHAGESSGPDGVRAALDELRVSRIDHGVRAAEDPPLLARLAAERVTLNVCLSSNCTLLYDGIAAHPIRTLLSAGVPVTLNTDDPVVLNTTLCNELVWAAGVLGWGIDELATCQRRAIDSAFCDDARKAALHRTLDAHLAAAGGRGTRAGAPA